MPLLAGLLLASPAAFGANIIHEFYVPLPEAQVKTALVSIEPASGIVGNTIESVISIVATGAGTVIHYDQWEDGYEVDLNNPTQSTTQIWGDGNDANGIPPGYAHDPASFTPGSVIVLRNQIPLPRNPANLFYDGRDRFGGTKALVVSRASWATTPGTVLCGANEIMATMDYGTNYIAPVGDDVVANSMFEYVGMFVMARDDNTSVAIDPDGSGATGATTITLNRGESYLFNGGIKKGATVVATKPVQAHLVTGDIGARYESRRFTLYPRDQWSSATYSPVGTAANGDQSYAYIYNPNVSSITINYTTCTGTGSFSVASNSVYQFLLPQNCGTKFVSVGEQPFAGVVTVGANPTANNVHDWGFTLVPSDNLTTEAVVGWGPGSSDLTQNGSPVWVTPIQDTTIYVDYNGDRAGPVSVPGGGNCDVSYTLSALQTQRLYDPDKDGTAMRIFTVDGTQITAAWGQDPATAGPALPYLDCGTTVLPFPVPQLKKAAVIVTDVAPTGASVNDIVEYTVTVDNHGLLPLGNLLVLDPLHASLQYQAGTTTRDGIAVTDDPTGTAFPLDSPGYNIPIILRGGTTVFKYRVKIIATGNITNVVNNTTYNLSADANLVVQPPAGSVQCGAQFTNSTGTVQSSYTPGTGIYATLTDNDANTSTTTVQTITVVINDTTSGDAEMITLTETGVNTGIFRNTAALATSTSIGGSTMDGTLHVTPGDSLSFVYVDPQYSDTCSGSASISVPTQNKFLYLRSDGADNDTTGSLTRVDPVAQADATTSSTAVLGAASSSTVTAGTATSTTATGSSMSFTHSVNTGTNRLLVVTVALGTATANPGTPGTVNTITYAGQAMTQVSTSWSGDGARAYVYVLKDDPGTSYVMPTTGLIAISASQADTRYDVGAITFTGVDQTTPYGTPATAGSGGASQATATVGVTSAVNELVLGFAAVDEGGSDQTMTTTTTGGQVELWKLNSNNLVTAGASTKPGAAGTVTQTWSLTPSSDWAAIALSIKPATVLSNTSATYTQTPAFAATFTLPAGAAPVVTTYYTVSTGSMPASPTITATLKKNGTTFATSTGASANATTGSGTLSFTFSGLGSAVNFAATDVMSLDVTTTQSGVSFKLDYDSSSKPAKITLPTTTVISVNSVAVYDAPYPGGSVITAPISGSTAYVRSVVSDPFGFADITSLGLNIDGPGTSDDVTTTLSSSVAAAGASKTFEYTWVVGSTVGTYNIIATANEGTEGITDTKSTLVNVSQLDLGTPSTTQFTTGLNGPTTSTYTGNEQVCVRVKDLDQNLNASAVETITATITSNVGDSELVTLTETGVNTGIFTYCINASTSASNTFNDGTLHAVLGDTLQVVYVDPTDPTDTSSANALIPNTVPALTVNKTLITPADGVCVVNEPVSFQIQVVNTGNTILTGISLVDTYPTAKLSFVSASGTYTPGAGTITWSTGTLNPGQSATYTANFTALAAAAPAINSAVATATGGTSGSDTANVTITNPHVSITKTRTSAATANVGDNVTFQIVATNNGSTAIASLPIEDTFSGANFDFVSASPAPDSTGSGSLLWLDVTGAGNLAVGNSVTINVTLKAKGAAAPATNLATADYTVDVNGDSAPSAQGSATVTLVAATIKGFVYDDKDGNVAFNGSDVPLEAITVKLYTDPNGDGDPADGTLVAIATTDVNGAYEFPNLSAQKYVVVESDPAGYSSTGDTGGANDNRIPLNVSTLTTFSGNNFFDKLPAPASYASISGKVWNDANASRTVNGGEVGLVNISVDLVQDVNGNGTADPGEPVYQSTLTDSAGAYSFGSLPTGNYVVVEHDSYGWMSTADSVGANNNQIPITATAGTSYPNMDFLDVQLGDITGTVFQDVNGNGSYDVGVDLLLANIDVQVTDFLGAVQTVSTNPSGVWTASVPPGLATVDVQQTDPQFVAVFPSGYTQTAGTDPSTVTAVSGVSTSAGVDGFRQVGTVTGHLYVDTNGNGTQDVGEPDLANVNVVVKDVDNVNRTVSTNASGNWTATIPPGAASANVDETDPDFTAVVLSGYSQTQGNDPTLFVVLANSSINGGTDGYYNPATVTGHLYVDLNGNSTQDPGEPNLANVDLVITDSLNNTQTVTTGPTGNWTATVPPGSTTANVDESDPQFPVGGVQTQGTDPTTVTAVAHSSVSAGINGYYIPATISGIISLDTNHDGNADSTISGVTVTLYTDPNNDGDPSDGSQYGATTTTSGAGVYTFSSLPPGHYVVVSDYPAGRLPVRDGDISVPNDDTANTDTTDMMIPVTVISNETDNGNNFLFEPAMTVGNMVFRDLNNNGHADAGEGVSGVLVELYDGSNVLINQATTNGSGFYTFSDIAPGSYYVKVPASEFGVGKPLRGLISMSGVQAGDDDAGEDGIDDASPATNGIRTALFSLLPGTAPTDAGTETGIGHASDNAADADVDLTVDLGYTCPTITLSPGSLAAAIVGTPYSQTISASGGIAPYSFTTADTLPAGLSLSSGGVISGTPTSAIGQTFTVLATDAVGCTASLAYTLTPSCPAITLSSTPALLPLAQNGVAYSASINAAGGSPTYSYSITGGALPGGLTLNPDGTITGTPSATAGSYNFTVTASDMYSCAGSAAFTISLGCPTITVSPGALLNGTTGVPYGPVNFTASGGTAPYTWTQNPGTSLPTGLTFNTTTAVFSGTPTQTGSWQLSITATDANGCAASANLTFDTTCPSLTVNGTLPAAMVNAAYNYTLTGSGGTGPYSFSTVDVLPAGLVLETSGQLHGTPTSTTSRTFTVSMTDANGCPGSRSFTLTPACPTLTLSPDPLPAATVNDPYAVAITASGGIAPYSFSTVDTLPTGLVLEANGILHGTPTSTVSRTFTVTVTDANNCPGSLTFTLAPACPTITLSPGALPAAMVNDAYDETFSASGGIAPYVFTTTDTLPTGLVLEANGRLHGTPTSTTQRDFTVKVTDANGCIATELYSLTPACPTLTVSPGSLPDATIGTAYSSQLSTTGGVLPYSYAVTNGSLPAGFNISPAGLITGTSTGPATTDNFVVTVTDANNCQVDVSLSITVNCNTLSLAPSSLTDGVVGTAYGPVTITATGANGALVWSVPTGALPTGMSLHPTTGVLSGTPTAAGTANFTIKAMDANGCVGTVPLTLTTACPTISLASTPAVLPGATNGTAYSASITASGGTANYSYTITGGALPNGLTMDNAGAISGTPNAASGAYPFTVKATDSYGCEGTGSFTISVNCGTITIAPGSLTPATTGVSYTPVIFSTTGSNGTLTWSLSAGTLPNGMTFNAGTATLSGTPTETGSFPITIAVLDQNGCGASTNLTLTVGCPAFTVNPGSLPNGTVNTAYNQLISATGGTAPYTFTTTDTLPAGLTLELNGQLHGLPTSVTSRTFTVKATDANGCEALSAAFTVAPACPSITLLPASLPAATVNDAYSQTITASSGIAPYLFTTADPLPAGLTLDSNGLLHGTPTSTASITFTVKATDANGCEGLLPYTMAPLCPTITVTPASLAAATVNTPYTDTVSASGGIAPYSFTTASTLPAGLTLETNGVLHGTPTSTITRTFTITATDANGCTGNVSYTMTPACPTLVVNPALLPAMTVNTPYDELLVGSGGIAPYTFTTPDPLPAGLVLESNGRVHGTPTSTQLRNVDITITDANGCNIELTYTMAPACPTITLTPASLSTAIVGVAYSQVIGASGGIAPYTFSTLDVLPAGLTLDSDGTLHGTPTSTTGHTFDVTAMDANGCTALQTFSLTPVCPVISLASLPAVLPDATNGSPYSASITASNGSPAYTYQITAGALPNGMALAPNGTISGTPNAAAGSNTFTVTVTDLYGCQGSAAFTISLNCPNITIAPTSLGNATTGVAYTAVTFNAVGGTGPYSWSETGALPPGMSFNTTTATLDGTPTAAGSYSFSVATLDSNGCGASVNLTLTVVCPAITVTPDPLPAATVGVAYSQLIAASGGTSPYTFSTVDVLPSGLTLDANGLLHGTPASTTSRTFTVVATDAHNCAGSLIYTLAPTCPTLTVDPLTLPDGAAGTPYSQTITATGGTAPYTFTTSNTLPAGLTLDPDGTLHGTPTSTLQRTFTVDVSDAYGCAGLRTYTMTPACPVLSFTPGSLPTPVANHFYSQTFSASGGVAPYTFLVTGGGPSSGLTLSPAGVLSGIPLTTTLVSFQVTVRDANFCSASQIYFMQPTCPTVTLDPTTLPGGQIGTPYSANISASGGIAPYGYAVSSGNLPPGLALETNGLLHGTPTLPGTANISITALDTNGCPGTLPYTITIGCPTISVTPALLPASAVGVPYSTTITASGGTPSYQFSVTSGTLPAGLTLDANGTLHGTPTSATAASFTITATDFTGCQGSLAYVVSPACPTISLASTPAVLPQGMLGDVYAGATLSASGGTGPYNFTVVGGSLPAGLTLAPNGTISGTPNGSPGPATFTVSALDAEGCSGTGVFTIGVDCNVLVLSPTTLPDATSGTFYGPVDLTATGGTGALTWSVTGGTLPNGIVLNTTSGQLLGLPTTAGTSNFAITAEDANGCQGSVNLSLTVLCPTLIVSPDPLTPASLNTPYDEQLLVSGGADPYTFTLNSGTFPNGITMTPDGEIVGTPTQTGSFPVVIHVVDAQSCSTNVSLTLNVQFATVHGHLYVDTNGNGHQDPSEPDLAGVDVVITDSNADTQTVSTDSNGNWTAIVPPGLTEANVKELDPQFVSLLPPGYQQTEGNDPTLFIVAAGANKDFGNDGWFVPAQLHGHVYVDLNGNGVQDSGEPPLVHVSVDVLDINGITHSVETDMTGLWTATVPPGATTVTVNELDPDFTANVPGAYQQSEGTNPNTFTAVANQDLSAGNDGYFIPGTIYGHVYLDLNGNGAQDGTEPGLANVDMIITDVNGVDHTVSTDGDGDWSILLPPGITTAKVKTTDPDFPAGVVQSQGNDPTTVTVVLNSNVNGGTDGYKPLPGSFSISGQVRDDFDGDGNFSDSDTPVSGVTMKLWLDVNDNGQLDGPDALMGTTVTNGNGQYTFGGLSNGHYLVEEVDPNPAQSTADVQGDLHDNLVAVTISGANVTARDFLDAVDPAGYIYDSITGAIVPGGSVTVSGPGTVSVLMNGSTGQYSFVTDGTPGVYTISFTPPTGYRLDNTRPAQPGAYDPTGLPDPTALGSSEDAGNPGYLVDHTAVANPYYYSFDLTPGDPFVINNNFPVLLIKPADYVYWKQVTPGAGGTPTSNNDCDNTNDLLEYALCGDPATGVQTRSLFCVQRNTITGHYDAVFKRPVGTSDVTYELQVITSLANSPGGWTTSNILPTVVVNGDGSESVTYPSVDTSAVLGSSPTGCARLKVTQTGAPNASSNTEAWGWTLRTVPSVCESICMPYLKKDILTGCVEGVAGNLVDVSGTAGSVSVKAQMVSGQQYFIECTNGDYEGQRWEVNEASSTATSIAIDLASALNTEPTLPDLTGLVITLRAHWQLGELFDKNVFHGGTSAVNADRLLFYDNATQNFNIKWLMDIPGLKRWTDVTITDQSARIIDNQEGFFVHPRNGAVSMGFCGAIRANAFACPLRTGYNFVGGGWPISQTPVQRDMTTLHGWTGNRNPLLADRVQFWANDTNINGTGYISHFLLVGGTRNQWTPEASATGLNENNVPIFTSIHAALIKPMTPKPTFIMPRAWTP